MKKIKLSKSNKFIISLIAISFICFFFTAKASRAEIGQAIIPCDIYSLSYQQNEGDPSNILTAPDSNRSAFNSVAGYDNTAVQIISRSYIDCDYQGLLPIGAGALTFATTSRINYLIDWAPNACSGTDCRTLQFYNYDSTLSGLQTSDFGRLKPSSGKIGIYEPEANMPLNSSQIYLTTNNLLWIGEAWASEKGSVSFAIKNLMDNGGSGDSDTATIIPWTNNQGYWLINSTTLTLDYDYTAGEEDENNPVFFNLPFNFKLGNVSCCENKDCNIPIQALNVSADLATIGLYNDDNTCVNGNSSYLAIINHYQWYRDPYDPLNQLIIPSSSLQSMGTYQYCLAGQFQQSGTTKTYQSGGHTFTVYASTSEMCIAPTALSFCDDPCVGIATSSIGGQIDCGYKKFVCWLTVPSEKSYDKMQNNLELLKLKFPFSAFTQISNSITNTIGSTTDDMTGSLSLPMYNGSSFYLVKIADSSTIPLAIGSENANTFRNTLIYLFWILGGLYILLRISIKFGK